MSDAEIINSSVAIIMAVAQGKMAHGPLRVIITTDEEDSMEGAFAMDASWLDVATYLINIDNENSSEVLVSTAAGDSVYTHTGLVRHEPSRAKTRHATSRMGEKGTFSLDT